MVKVAALVMGIVGAFAVFYGLVLLLVGDEQSLAFVGYTWRAGDVAGVWAWALLLAGAALLAAAAYVFLRARRRPAG